MEIKELGTSYNVYATSVAMKSLWFEIKPTKKDDGTLAWGVKAVRTEEYYSDKYFNFLHDAFSYCKEIIKISFGHDDMPEHTLNKLRDIARHCKYSNAPLPPELTDAEREIIDVYYSKS